MVAVKMKINYIIPCREEWNKRSKSEPQQMHLSILSSADIQAT